MEDHINIPGAIAGVIVLVVLAILVRLYSAFADVLPQPLAAWRRSFGVAIAPQAPGIHIHLGSMENGGLPIYQEHHRRLGLSVASVPYPPPAYGSHTADRTYNGPIHGNVNVGNLRGISVAVVPTLQPPPYVINPDAGHHSL
ncbi:hypothetical protein M407DRAFT_19479 [Tulasnella calospora MUT 4182]|uniref:Uncharacterized protein n=1 Tax=Tulasnella calospora MUT 4182 TaxID=1051891 RepID=A0A0C3MCP6_9AGAM|nr:hypothetical protein M407DRAFT_19479 [Tulasnella calospora MUT 4182]